MKKLLLAGGAALMMTASAHADETTDVTTRWHVARGANCEVSVDGTTVVPHREGNGTLNYLHPDRSTYTYECDHLIGDVQMGDQIVPIR